MAKVCSYCANPAAELTNFWPAGGVQSCDGDTCFKLYSQDYQRANEMGLRDCCYSAMCTHVAVDMLVMMPVGTVAICREHKSFYDRMGV